MWSITATTPAKNDAKVTIPQSPNPPGSPSAKLDARWIWAHEDYLRAGGGETALFRKSLKLDDVPDNAAVIITCDNTYRISINGKLVGADASWEQAEIYRIDHYLGKETVQNILVFRFANGIFEPVWDHRYVDHVQITVSEELGVGHRGKYYEEAGALRDMVPNHMFQLLALISMEPPDVVRRRCGAQREGQGAQCDPSPDPGGGALADRAGAVRARLRPEGIPAGGARRPDSRVETYVAMKLAIDNWRWADVPFFLRTGKRLPRRVTEIVIQFKRVPFMLFRHTPVDHLEPNQLVLRIQPKRVDLAPVRRQGAGPSVEIGNVQMDLLLRRTVRRGSVDRLRDPAPRRDERRRHPLSAGRQRGAGWEVVEPILDVWRGIPPARSRTTRPGAGAPRRRRS